jgi:hypothetical protein
VRFGFPAQRLLEDVNLGPSPTGSRFVDTQVDILRDKLHAAAAKQEVRASRVFTAETDIVEVPEKRRIGE